MRRLNLLSRLLLVTLAFFALACPTAYARDLDDQETSRTETEAGRYLAVLGDCTACHTGRRRAAFSGGVPFNLPIGTLYASNITPDPKVGIGAYTEKEFARAVREGVRKDGQPLYPAMPYPSYARLSDKDVHNLYVYFMRGVKPSSEPTPANTIMWPFSIRWPLHIWQTLFVPSPKTALLATDADGKNPQTERGAYLVEGLGHCGSCHTPRGIFMQERALTVQDHPDYLSGGDPVDGWTSPNLRDANRTGLERWSEEDIVTFLKTGRNAHGISFGPMDDVIVHSTSQWTDSDLRAAAAFLKTVPAPHQEPWQYDSRAIDDVRAGRVTTKGEQIYLDRCAACHGSDGKGYGTAFPPLAGNPVLMAPSAMNVVHIVQSGATVAATKDAPSALAMPSFGDLLTDAQIADVVNYVRVHWGNRAEPVTTEDVKSMRRSTPPPVPAADQPNN